MVCLSFQTDSIFNLKSPFDLVTFIRQQNAFDRLQVLREEYLQEKKKLIYGREKEQEEIRKSFYKMDPDCVDAGNHISEFELHLYLYFQLHLYLYFQLQFYGYDQMRLTSN